MNEPKDSTNPSIQSTFTLNLQALECISKESQLRFTSTDSLPPPLSRDFISQVTRPALIQAYQTHPCNLDEIALALLSNQQLLNTSCFSEDTFPTFDLGSSSEPSLPPLLAGPYQIHMCYPIDANHESTGSFEDISNPQECETPAFLTATIDFDLTQFPSSLLNLSLTLSCECSY